MQTLTNYENPRSLVDIMHDAWTVHRDLGARFGDCLRAAWAMAKRKAGKRLPDRPQTLTQFLYNRGGIKPCDELRAVGAPLCVLNSRGWTLDDMARQAADEGFNTKSDPNELLEMIRDETTGAYHYAMSDWAVAMDHDELNEIPF